MTERVDPDPRVPAADSGTIPESAHESPPNGAVDAESSAAIPGVRLLSGRYRLGQILGYGGMAEVYRARDIRLERDVAIKILRTDLARDPTFQARFKREAQSAAALNHPMIVGVYDTGSDEKHDPPLPYIVMEYVDGRTLRDVLQHEGRLTQRRALEIAIDVCAALEYSHRAGIIHRDIKPGNVMISRDGAVKVMDFGIARAVAQSTATVTQTAAVMGTAQYLSPEQARGDKVDSRSDLYSTGVLLYELLTGQPPFTGDSPVAVAYQHVREDPVPPSDIERDLSGDVDAVIMKMLAKNPGNRYQTASELSDDLNRLLSGRRVLATPLLREPPPRPPRVRRNGKGNGGPPRRRGRKILLAVILAILAAGAVTGGLLLARDSASSDNEIAVPPVDGMQLNAAKRAIERSGLTVGRQVPKASDAPVNTVLSTDPVAGVKLHKKAPVTITYSAGQPTVTVPNVIGDKLAPAEQKVHDAGLTTTVNLVVTPGKPIGIVSSTRPSAGTYIVTGQQVTLDLESAFTKVPDLVGQDINSAQAALYDADLTYQIEQRVTAFPPGQVIAQDLSAGSAQKRGAQVTLVVSVSPPPTPTPTAGPTQPTPKPSHSPPAKPTQTPAPPSKEPSGKPGG